MGDTGRVRVWDALVRLSHWALVASVAGSWLTRHGGGRWHEWLGLAAGAIVAVRLVWGWIGTRHARFSEFVRGPSATLVYARALLAGTAPRHLGHNPLGGWMIVALLAVVAALSFTGWLFTTDRFWGEPWLDTLHGLLADGLLVLVTVHLLGVLHASFRHRENLIAAMIHGCKRADRVESTTQRAARLEIDSDDAR